MDGMELATGVLVLGATNRPQAVDAALLRPGRFDALLYVPPPDEEGRLAVLKVHTKRMPLAQDVDLVGIARETCNFTGAELANLCREAALAAVRENMEDAREVAARHFADARCAMRAPALDASLLEEFAAWKTTRQRLTS
ncbi:P-loop containing nucleoside triphosphate hydrolase protein [Dunaliella salina]|uniref:P-loop containing nucleoside triphosphate hydrolase protein n=1 Tax=Dunaliella salina TaxID=3046 RepID=A0ABQ7GZ64_DUNSA|nr:P-loop containing nucleoside triphosphate hydrolase protein [Dunaliella salina]|eukprot:KAF5839902.1 P-loop containing nucleoside triphosphate hydrolase protein [Dunaliella salina]